MKKEKVYDIVLGGTMEGGVATATATINKNGKPWVVSVTKYPFMTKTEFDALIKYVNDTFGKMRMKNLSIDEVLDREKKGANALIGLGWKAAKAK